MGFQNRLFAIGLTMIAAPVWAAEAPPVPASALPEGAAKSVMVPPAETSSETAAKTEAVAKTEAGTNTTAVAEKSEEKGPPKNKPVALRAGIGSYYLESAWAVGNRPFYHIGAAYQFNPDWSAELLVGMLRTKERYTARDPFWLLEYDLVGRYHLPSWKVFKPLILAGMGAQTLEGEGNYDRDVLMAIAGVGVAYPLGADYDLFLEWRQNWQRFKLPNRAAGEKHHHMDHAGVVNLSVVGHYSFERESMPTVVKK